MKKLRIPTLILIVVGLLLSACKVNTPTPPVVTDAPKATEVDEFPSTSQSSAQPTLPPIPVPTVDTRLFDENKRMICSITPGLFPDLTEEQEEMLSVFPKPSEKDWSVGPEDATITIIEYSDLQCSACKIFYLELEKLLAARPDDVRLIFRHFPLVGIHPNATVASQAAEAAGLQHKFWEMYHALFTKQEEWSRLSEEEFATWLSEEAAALELDVAQFNADLNSESIVNKIQEDLKFGAEKLQIQGTPTILINGRPWQFQWSAAVLSMVIDVISFEKDGLYKECPPWMLEEGKNYEATIKTEKGDIVVDLFENDAPLTVNSFVFLAREGFFDGITFHRVIKDFVAQGGDPSGTGISGPGYEYRNEISPNLDYSEAGMLGMANSGPDTNGSQFFITLAANDNTKQLTGGYTIFGKVISGMDVALALTERDPSTDNPPAADKIITITIEEK